MRLWAHLCTLCLCLSCMLTAPSAAQNAQSHKTQQPSAQADQEQSRDDQQPSQHPAGASSNNILKEPASTVADQKIPEAASRTLTKHEKLQHWLHRTYSPYTFGGVAFDATWAQMWGDWPQYGGGMQGWGKRFGATLGDTETRTFFGQFLFPVLFHQDPRYIPSRYHGLIPRAWYASTRVLITRRDGDGNTFNSSEFAAVLATAAVQNAYYPERDKGFNETMSRFIGGVGSDVTSNLLREFAPDIKRIFRRHEPEKLKQMEEKVPGAKKIEQMATPH